MRYTYLLMILLILSSGLIARSAYVDEIEICYDYQKIFVHTDRDYYTAGGEIYFKVYVSDLSGAISEKQQENLYVDLIDSKGSITHTTLVKVTTGTASGTLKLKGNMTTDVYKLRAYTERIKEDPPLHFLKTIMINGAPSEGKRARIVNDTIYIAILPEGGNAVDNTKSRIGIHATDYQGNPVRMNAELLDNGAFFETNTEGLAVIDVAWSLDKEYTIKSGLSNPLKYSFPSIYKEGATLRVDNRAEQLEITVSASNSIDGVEVVISQHDRVIDQLPVSELLWVNKIDKENLPKGILQFTLISKSGDPVAERLSFNDYGIDNFNVDVEASEEEYGVLEEVSLTIDLYDDEGESLSANLSVSVVDRNIVNTIGGNSNIQTNHYVTSYLQGRIINPNDYFTEEGGVDTDKVDLLMLTYGWRKFKKPIKNLKTEEGFKISGIITKKDNPDLGVQSKGFLSILSKEFSLIPFVTDGEGRFEVPDFKFYGSKDVFIQAEIDNKKSNKNNNRDQLVLSGSRNVDILLDQQGHAAIAPTYINELMNYGLLPPALRLRDLESIKMSEQDLDIQMNVDLDAVTVTEEKFDLAIEEFKPSMLYGSPDNRIKVSEIPQALGYEDIYDVLMGRIPGIRLDGPSPTTGAKHKIILRDNVRGIAGIGSNGMYFTDEGARFYVNGTSVSEVFAETIRPIDIEFIDVVKTLYSLTGYGGEGVNGIIFIYLKSPEFRDFGERKTQNGILNTVIEGYNLAREFYKPKTDSMSSSKRHVTIHWEPEIIVDESGTASISFYTSNVSSTYDIMIQGLTKDGLPIVKKSKIVVK